MAISTVGELIRAARNGRSQKEFATLLGVKQSSVSRYESGRANPPVSIIEQCMHLVHMRELPETPTADELAERVRTELAGPGYDQVRSALHRLMDAFVAEHAQARVSGDALHLSRGR